MQPRHFMSQDFYVTGWRMEKRTRQNAAQRCSRSSRLDDDMDEEGMDERRKRTVRIVRERESGKSSEDIKGRSRCTEMEVLSFAAFPFILAFHSRFLPRLCSITSTILLLLPSPLMIGQEIERETPVSFYFRRESRITDCHLIVLSSCRVLFPFFISCPASESERELRISGWTTSFSIKGDTERTSQAGERMSELRQE